MVKKRSYKIMFLVMLLSMRVDLIWSAPQSNGAPGGQNPPPNPAPSPVKAAPQPKSLQTPTPAKSKLDKNIAEKKSMFDRELIAAIFGNDDNPDIVVAKVTSANVNTETNLNGNTLLHLAAQQNKPKMVAKLIELGADVNIKNDNGFSAFAKAYRHNRVSELFDSGLLMYIFDYLYANKGNAKDVINPAGAEKPFINWFNKKQCLRVMQCLHRKYRCLKTSDEDCKKAIRIFVLCAAIRPQYASEFKNMTQYDRVYLRMEKEAELYKQGDKYTNFSENIIVRGSSTGAKTAIIIITTFLAFPLGIYLAIIEIMNATKATHVYDTFQHFAVRHIDRLSDKDDDKDNIMLRALLKDANDHASNKNKINNIHTFGGNKPIHHAAKYENNEALEYLISINTDITTVEKNGYTPLHFIADKNTASSGFCCAAFKTLSKLNTFKNCLMMTTKSQSTALHLAAAKNVDIVDLITTSDALTSSDLVKLLLMKNKKGKMAIDVAAAAGQDAIVTSLLTLMIKQLLLTATDDFKVKKPTQGSSITPDQQAKIDRVIVLLTLMTKYLSSIKKNQISLTTVYGLIDTAIQDNSIHSAIRDRANDFKKVVSVDTEFKNANNDPNKLTAFVSFFNKAWNTNVKEQLMLWACCTQKVPFACFKPIIDFCVNKKDIDTLRDLVMIPASMNCACDAVMAWKQNDDTKKTVLHVLAEYIKVDDVDENSEVLSLTTIIAAFKEAGSLDAIDSMGRTALSYVIENPKAAASLLPGFLKSGSNIFTPFSTKNQTMIYDYASDTIKDSINYSQLTIYDMDKVDDKRKEVLARILANEKTIQGCLNWSSNEATLYTLASESNQDLTLLKKCINTELDAQFLTYISDNQDKKETSQFDEFVHLYPITANEWASKKLTDEYGLYSGPKPKTSKFLDLVDALDDLDATKNIVTKAESWTLDGIEIKPWLKDGKTAQQIFNAAPNKKQKSAPTQVPVQSQPSGKPLASASAVSEVSRFVSLGSRIMNRLKGLVQFS